MTESSENTPTLADLNKQTATVAWDELVRHFARGVLITVDANLDLVAVAERMAADDAAAVKTLLEKGTVRRASDEDARHWNQTSPVFWCVVAAPWVLVQEQKAR